MAKLSPWLKGEPALPGVYRRDTTPHPYARWAPDIGWLMSQDTVLRAHLEDSKSGMQQGMYRGLAESPNKKGGRS